MAGRGRSRRDGPYSDGELAYYASLVSSDDPDGPPPDAQLGPDDTNIADHGDTCWSI